METVHFFPDSAARVPTLIMIILVLDCGQLCGQAPAVKNILLIHGTFSEGPGWQGVFRILNARLYPITGVQDPDSSFTEDVAADVSLWTEAGSVK